MCSDCCRMDLRMRLGVGIGKGLGKGLGLGLGMGAAGRATGQSLCGDDRMLHLSVIVVLRACHLDRAVGNPLLFN